MLGSDADPVAATASYERAFAVAERVGARMPQMRAAVRLVRTAPAGERAGRVDALRAVHATFTEGQSTPDLFEASEILA